MTNIVFPEEQCHVEQVLKEFVITFTNNFFAIT
jgi:hypothetical protein